MSQSERRLAAIMYTDMVGYTALGQRDESLSLAIVEAQQKVLGPVLARHSGRVVKTMGDAFLVEFTNALEAARCAYDVQRSVREFNLALSSEKRIHLRVGIHLGDVVEKEGDIFGDAVNVASRIEPLAVDGGVCITQQVYDQVKNKLDVPLVSKGKMNLKNVSEPVEVYRMVMPWEKEGEGVSRADEHRIAVLPFVNFSPDPDDEFFADGMTEEIISTVSGISDLSVISRTSVMGYKGTTKRVREIGRELEVGSVLEGSFRKAGNRIRVTTQLIDVAGDKHLWAQSYDRELDDIFKVQDDIAGKIAGALRVRFATAQGPVRKRTESIEAYTLYLKGRSLWNKRDKEGVLESLKLFQEAVKIDPDYARAYSGLADAYYIAASNGFMERTDGLAKSKEAVTKALELDDALAEAHASLGINLHGDLRYEEALRELRRAIELNPSYASAHHWYSLCLSAMGRIKEGDEEMEKARELDPLSQVITLNVGATNLVNGRLDEAFAIYDKLIENDPTYANAYWARALYFMYKGMKERALADVEASNKLTPDEEDVNKIGLAFLYAWFGEREKALPLIEELIPKVGKSSVPELGIASCYAVLGDTDEFFKWVDKAIAAKRIDLGSLRAPNPFYDKMREDPRFPEIFKKLGLPY
jgi:adenylate cyclase